MKYLKTARGAISAEIGLKSPEPSKLDPGNTGGRRQHNA